MYGDLREGPRALTVIALPRGRFRSLTLFSDSSRQNLDPAELRVALYHHEYGFQSQPVLLDGAKGPVEIMFTDPEHIGGISIERRDFGNVHVSWAVI